MPRTVNPASISVGAGIAPQGTVEDNSFRYPQRDIDPLRAHLQDPNNAHMAAAIGIVDAGGFFSSTDVEGALQELGGGGAAGRHNGLVLGGTFTSGPGLLTLDTPTQVLIGGVLASFGGATVVLPPSVTRYVWIDPTTSTLTASPALPAVSSEPILIAKVVTDAGANVTSSQDARFFVANLDRKLDYTLRSDGSAVNDASEACFVTLDAALFWLENYVSTGQERKAVVVVRGNHTISSTVVLPAGVPNVEFRGEGGASFSTGAPLLFPMFDVSGTTGATFSGINFICDHSVSVAISTNNPALACSNVTVRNCRFITGGATWIIGVQLYQATPNIQQGHRVLDSEFTASTTAVRIDRAVGCVVRDCTMTGNNTAGSFGTSLMRAGGVGENCLVDNVQANNFGYPFYTTTDTTTLRKCLSTSGAVVVGGKASVVDGCTFASATVTGGLSVDTTATGTVVSDTTVTSTAVHPALSDPAGIFLRADGAVVTGCTVTGFYSAGPGNNGAGVRVLDSSGNKVVATDISNCGTGVELTGTASTTSVDTCTLTAKVVGVFAAPTTSGVRVTNSTILLDSVTGVEGVVVLGSGAFVLGCNVATARAFNTYAVGEVPAGVRCGTTGPYLIEGCSFTNFYDSTNHSGGGVCAGDVTNVVVTGCTFVEGGVNLDGTTLGSVLVTGCTFYANAPALRHLGVTVTADTLLDMGVTGCVFKFNSDDTYYGVDVSASVGLNRVVVSNCTYTNTVSPAGVEAFVHITTGLGDNVLIEGNSVSYPTAHTSGCIFIAGVEAVTITGNSITSGTPSTGGTAVRVQSKTVTCVSNTLIGMRGIVLVAAGGYLPTLQASGNTFDGGDDTAMVGISLSTVGAAPVTAYNTTVTGNVFMNYLTAVDLTTPASNTLSKFAFTGNTVSGCRYGVVTDALTADTLSVSSNTFTIYDYAFFYNRASATYTNCMVNGNTVTQVGFVGPVFAQGVLALTGAVVANLSVSGNTLDHEGAVGGVSVTLTGQGAHDISVDGNTVRNEVATSNHPILVALSSTVVGFPQASNISVSRNTVRHFGNSYDAIRLELSSSLVPNTFRNVRMNANSVVAQQNNASNGGVVLLVSGVGGVFPTVRSVSMNQNGVSTFGPSVKFQASDMGRIENVSLCENTAVAGNVSSVGAIYFECSYTGGGGVSPATALVDGVTLSRNAVKYSASNFAVRVECAAPAMNLSVDENSVVQVGDVGSPFLNTGNIYLSLPNTSAFGTRNAATCVSVCRNKVSGVNYGEAAILLNTPGGLVTQGENITVDDNEVFNHVRAAIKVQFGYDAIQNLSVSGNKVRDVGGNAVRVDNALAVYGLNISDNTIHGALSAGVAGAATIAVVLDAGEGFVFTGNRLGATSRRGIYVDGGSATSALDAVTFTGNNISFSGGTSPEEGVYLSWQYLLTTVTASGNVVRGATTGIYVDGGFPTSSLGLPSSVRGVAILGNSITATDCGVRVSNHTTDSGLGTARLEGVRVSGNTINSGSTSGAMVYGVIVDTVFGTLDKTGISGNTVDMGSLSTGAGMVVSANDAVPSQVSVTDNSTLYGEYGVSIQGNNASVFSDITVCRNQLSTLTTDGIHIGGMTALTNVMVDGNTIEGTGAKGVSLSSSSMQSDSRNISVSNNSVNSTEGVGLWVQLLQSSSTPSVYNLSVCHNKVSNWNEGSAAAATIPAIRISLCDDPTKPHPLQNLNVSHNLCENVTDDWVCGFKFFLDEKTRQVVFAHNQVLLDNQTNAAAMDWTFANTGAFVPKDFSFTGNQFRNTNGVGPTYTGATGDFATFYGNIGSAANFWTTFATNWTTYVPNAAIATHNIDNGT